MTRRDLLSMLSLAVVAVGCGTKDYGTPKIDPVEAKKHEEEINKQMEEEMNKQMGGRKKK